MKDYTVSITTSPTKGSVVDNGDGTFTYTANVNTIGTDLFEFTVTDSVPGTTPAAGSGTIVLTNDAPIAVDDEVVGITITDPPTPIPIFVLGNDSDNDGDQIKIDSVTSSVEGGIVTIDASKTFIWYTPPAFTEGAGGTEGTVLTFPTDGPYDDGGVPFEDGNLVGFILFEDTFNYTVKDAVGAISPFAQVKVKGKDPTLWVNKLTTGNGGGFVDSCTAAQVGVDGSFGYDLWIKRVFGGDARGTKFAAGAQFWQENKISARGAMIDGDDGGVVKLGQQNSVIVDVVVAGHPTPFPLWDNLANKGFESPGKQALYLIQSVDKKQGFRPANVDALTPGTRYASPAEQALLAQMTGPLLEQSDLYVFVDKQTIECMHTAGTMSDETYNAIKADLAGFGIGWETINNRYEQLQIGDLGVWNYSE